MNRNMSLDAIKTIKDAEAEALRIKDEAAANARKLILDADAKGRADTEEAKRLAERQASNSLNDADARGKQAALELAQTTENKKATIRARGEGRLDAAASLIISRITGQ